MEGQTKYNDKKKNKNKRQAMIDKKLQDVGHLIKEC
jgi:hypothetical protein